MARISSCAAQDRMGLLFQPSLRIRRDPPDPVDLMVDQVPGLLLIGIQDHGPDIQGGLGGVLFLAERSQRFQGALHPGYVCKMVADRKSVV